MLALLDNEAMRTPYLSYCGEHSIVSLLSALLYERKEKKRKVISCTIPFTPIFLLPLIEAL